MGGATAVAKKKKERKELRVDAEWLATVEKEAERWGLSVSGYIRLAVNEKMERDARRTPPEKREDRP